MINNLYELLGSGNLSPFDEDMLVAVIRQLEAAEKVVEKARNPQCDVGRNWSGAYVHTSWHDDLEEAVEVYDAVSKVREAALKPTEHPLRGNK